MRIGLIWCYNFCIACEQIKLFQELRTVQWKWDHIEQQQQHVALCQTDNSLCQVFEEISWCNTIDHRQPQDDCHDLWIWPLIKKIYWFNHAPNAKKSIISLFISKITSYGFVFVVLWWKSNVLKAVSTIINNFVDDSWVSRGKKRTNNETMN